MDRKTVIYWASRAIRTQENPALHFAQKYALQNNHAFLVVFNLNPDFPYANLRNMDFLLRGLLEMTNKLRAQSIPLILVEGKAEENFAKLMKERTVAAMISEHHVLKPMMLVQDRVRALCAFNEIPFFTLNTSCVVDVEIASPKLEYAARTFRPKIMAKYKDYLTKIQPLVQPTQTLPEFHVFDEAQYQDILSRYPRWNTVSRSSLMPGEDAANLRLRQFLKDDLSKYDRRFEYDLHAQSMLSAYLHFGMISPVQVVREAEESKHPNAPMFVEEVLVRRELAENYCHYCKDYDKLDGAWTWAKNTLRQHKNDPRDYNYAFVDFEAAKTHDELWNFCQTTVVNTGYLHSYLRMYWAKMVLLWTPDAQTAIDILIHLNDTYMLDGRDPNGYAGILWCVAGVHDRPWYNKPIHGLIRAMGKEGTLKKTKLKI